MSTRIADAFQQFASDFERCVRDDEWGRLERHLAADATYLNVGGPDPKQEGRSEVIAFLKGDVTGTDRRFDTRTLVSRSEPVVTKDRLTREWRCTYTLSGAPDLVVEGEARYRFENGLIQEMEEELTPDSARRFEEWMRRYGGLLKT